MKEEIKSVWDAFGMQPFSFCVGQISDPYVENKKIVVRIVREDVYDTGNPYDFYVGYHEDGSKAFQMRVQTTNVAFK